MYVERKNLPTYVSLKTAESVYFFYKVVVHLSKSAALKNGRFFQASNHRTIEGSKPEKILNKSVLLLGTPAVS